MKPFSLAPLKRFGRIVGGATPTAEAANWGGDVPWYTPTDVSAVHGKLLGESARTLTEVGLTSCAAALLPARSVVITSRAPIGNVALTDREAATNQGCKSVVPARDVDARFIAYAAQAFLDRLQVAGTGTTFQEISGERLGSVGFPVADGDTQRAIADFLDRECQRVAWSRDALVSPLRVVPDLPVRNLLDDLRALDLPAVRLRFGIDSLSQGWSPECWDRPREGDEWGVLKLGCVNGGSFTPDHKTLPTELDPRPKLEVVAGDLVMSRANTRALVGSAAVVPVGAERRLMLSDLLYRVRLRPDAWHAPFVAAVLNSPLGRGQIEAAAAGSSGSMPKISQGIIRELRLPSPTVEQQVAIAEQYENTRVGVEAVVSTASRVDGLLTEYRDALIHEAVTGKLDVTRVSENQMDERLHAAAEDRLDEVSV